MPYIVNLEPGVWLTKGEGDPPRTLSSYNAVHFISRRAAEKALKKAREFRPFPNAYLAWAEIDD